MSTPCANTGATPLCMKSQAWFDTQSQSLTFYPPFDYPARTMLAQVRHEKNRPSFQPTAQATLPGWALRIFENSSRQEIKQPSLCGQDNEVTIRIAENSDLLLIEICVRHASSMEPLALQQRTVEAYRAIHHLLDEKQSRHAIRIWNYIPNIQTMLPDGLDRYMIFNAGRFAAYYDWYGRDKTLETSIATATGIGYAGSDLCVQVLASTQQGKPVENPRQVRSYRYSPRYGPLPPCFARATLTSKRESTLPDLLIGGTASVCGERSIHDQDIIAQTKETLINLGHLVHAAAQLDNHSGLKDKSVDVDVQLRRFESMRVYYRDKCHLNPIMDIVWPHIDHLDPSQIEVVHANICRRELLVEIEGTASLDRPQ